MKSFIKLAALLLALSFAAASWAAADIEINTPAVAALTQSMQSRYAQLAAHYASGAVGLTADGFVAVRDASAVPLAERQAVNALVTAENHDRKALYSEIARANGHPEWADDIRNTFAQRWILRAQAGWWIQGPKGWVKK
jgi:uncharacterized protein YdbL (DUF1318 family)